MLWLRASYALCPSRIKPLPGNPRAAYASSNLRDPGRVARSAAGPAHGGIAAMMGWRGPRSAASEGAVVRTAPRVRTDTCEGDDRQSPRPGRDASDRFREDLAMLIRRERPADHTAVRAVIAEAFKSRAAPQDVPVEVGLVDALRASSEWIPQLSMVAESDEGEVVGYVVCTRGSVDGRAALGLGPLAVTPPAQRRGVGSALMHAVLGAADALDEPLVALLGHTQYYPRFGFRPADQHGVRPPLEAWASHFQARVLSNHQPDLRGTFRYAQPFDDL